TRLVQNRLHRFGYHMIRLGPAAVGGDPYRDLASLTTNPRPMIFDVGANLGQTIRKLREVMPGGTIHSFEPGPSTFAKLEENCSGLAEVHLHHGGLGATTGELTFHENELSELSSFLPLGAEGWGNVVRQVSVPVDTLDSFCA